MRAIKPLFSTLVFTLAATGAFAQNGMPASDLASPPPDEQFELNTEAWDSFVSFNGDRIFGGDGTHSYIPAFTYYSSFTQAGKRLAKDTFVPSFSTYGPLFGGEGYATFTGVLPADGDEVYQFNGVGGWKYRLFEEVDIDVGGGVAFFDKNSFGAGQPFEFGSYYRSAMYVGFIGRVPLRPYVYIVYGSQLQQVQAVVGISEEWDLGELIDWEGFKLVAEARGAQLASLSYLGDSRAPLAGKWRNGYTYWQTTLDLVWNPIKNGTMVFGFGYTGNNDGERGIYNVDLGPENTFWGKVSVSYAF